MREGLQIINNFLTDVIKKNHINNKIFLKDKKQTEKNLNLHLQKIYNTSKKRIS